MTSKVRLLHNLKGINNKIKIKLDPPLHTKYLDALKKEKNMRFNVLLVDPHQCAVFEVKNPAHKPTEQQKSCQSGSK